MLRRVKKPIILITNKIDDAHLSRRFITSGRWVWVSRSRVGSARPWPGDALDEILRSCRSTRSSLSRRRWAARVVWLWWSPERG